MSCRHPLLQAEVLRPNEQYDELFNGEKREGDHLPILLLRGQGDEEPDDHVRNALRVVDQEELPQ